MKRFWFSGFFALGIVAGLSVGAPAAADVVINGMFYEESNSFSCNTSVNCEIQFTPPPQRVRFTKINCSMARFSTDVLEIYFGVQDNTQTGSRRHEYFPFDPPRTTQSGLRYYAFSAPMDFLFAPGKIPVFRAVSATLGFGNLNCKITGGFE